MRPCGRLVRLEKSTCRNFLKLNNIIAISQMTKYSMFREALITYVVIEAHNTWRNFVRAYFLSCTLNPITSSGKKISTNLGTISFNQSLGLAVRAYRSNATPLQDGSWHRRDEPAWHDPSVFMTLCDSVLGCSNIIDIRDAFSAGFSVFADLPVYRNFVAHRNMQTQSAAQTISPRYGIPATIRPTITLLTRPLGRHQPLMQDWIDEFRFTVEYLCH